MQRRVGNSPGPGVGGRIPHPPYITSRSLTFLPSPHRFSTSRQTLTWIPDSFFSRWFGRASLGRGGEGREENVWGDLKSPPRTYTLQPLTPALCRFPAVF